MTPLKIPLRAVFYREGASWIAHCLEFDLIGDGDTKEQALEQLLEAIILQLEASVRYDNLKNLFTPADGEFFRKYAAGKKSDIATGLLHLSQDSVTIEEMDVRVYSEDDELAMA